MSSWPASFPSVLVPLCGVVDVPFGVMVEVLGDRGRQGTWSWWRGLGGMRKGGRWWGNVHIWPFAARSELGNCWNWRKCGVWAYWVHFYVDFDDSNINLKGLLCIFWMWDVFLRIFMFSLIILCSFCKIDLIFRFFIPQKGVKETFKFIFRLYAINAFFWYIIYIYT